jgi:hypothetical protein
MVIKMLYQTVFDISTAGYKSLPYAAFGLIFVAIGIGAVISKKYYLAKNPKFTRIFTFIWLGFAILWTIIAFSTTFYQYYHLLSEYNNGNFQVAEGRVTNFIPMPATGHSNERFCVDNNPCFEYSDYGITAGFNNAHSHGGPITEGLPVRVSYIGDVIVKLEVGKE